MMKRSHHLFRRSFVPVTLGLCMLGTGLAGCESEESGIQDEALGPGTNTARRAGEFTLTIPVAAQIANAPLACGVEYPGFGISNSTVQFSEFTLYVHGVQLKNEDGAWVPMRMMDDGMWQRDGIAMLDLLGHGSPACNAQGTADVHSSITGFMPQGDYSAIRFTLGVPASHNHMNATTAVAPFNRQRMWWSWASGFRYLKADMVVKTTMPDGTVRQKPKYYAHLGGHKCSKDPATMVYSCQDPRLSVVELPLDPSKQGIVLDPMALFAQDDLNVGRGCMGGSSLKDFSDPKGVVPTSCNSQYLAIGLNTQGEVASPVGSQSLFRAAAWSGTTPSPATLMPLELANTPQGRRNPALWPRSDYQRPAALDQSATASAPFGPLSHPPGDPRHGSSCLNCHQANGPGAGRFEFAGTVFREDGSPYGEGEVEIVLSNGPGKWGEKDPNKKIPNPTVHMRIPIDAQGQFFAPRSVVQAFASVNGVAPLDYANASYQAFILNRDGERIMGMSPKKAASCNQCHTGGFRLVVPSRLMSGPWTPAAGQ